MIINYSCRKPLKFFKCADRNTKKKTEEEKNEAKKEKEKTKKEFNMKEGKPFKI